jgi:integrase
MGRGRQGSGVEPLKNTIRVRFTWMGVREAVTLDLKPTPPNIRAAEKLMQRVRMAIEGAPSGMRTSSLS